MVGTTLPGKEGHVYCLAFVATTPVLRNENTYRYRFKSQIPPSSFQSFLRPHEEVTCDPRKIQNTLSVRTARFFSPDSQH